MLGRTKLFRLLLLFAACTAGSIAMFLKCKPWEHQKN